MNSVGWVERTETHQAGLQRYRDGFRWRSTHPTVLALAFALLPLTANAQDYPARTIRIIVPNPPGGAGDISARLIGPKLSESLRLPVVGENQPGAPGAIGMNTLKRAAPDGGTLGAVISLAHTIDRSQHQAGPVDQVNDLT